MVRSLIESGFKCPGRSNHQLVQVNRHLGHCQWALPRLGPNPASPLLAQCQAVYRQLHDHDAHIQVIHAGLECGLIAAKYPGMDIVSFGPTIWGRTHRANRSKSQR